VLIVVALILAPGTILATLAYSLHLRSDAYREAFTTELSERLDMFVTIERIRPLALDSKAFNDVRVYLDESGPQVFSCARAKWGPKSRGEGAEYLLELTDGWLLVGTADWTEREYRRILTGGLGHDFAGLGLTEVRLEDIDLRFILPLFEFRAAKTSGVVMFDSRGSGLASLNCSRLNRVDVAEPVNVAIRFTPGERLALHEVRLTVPTVPIAALGLDDLLQNHMSRGDFEGTISYQQGEEGETVEVTGSLRDAELSEFTAAVDGGPFHGRIDIDLQEAAFVGRRLHVLELHGKLSDLYVGELAPRLATSAAEGRMDLKLDRVRWQDGRLARLSASGKCDDLSLGSISALLGKGTITGIVALDIRSILIVDDELRFADVEIAVRPPVDGPGLIDRELIARAAQQWVGVDLTKALPGQIEYEQLGMRLIVDNGELKVLGTHGPDDRTILTINILGRSWGVIRQPQRTFTLPDLIALFRENAEDVNVDQVRSWWMWLRDTEGRRQKAEG